MGNKESGSQTYMSATKLDRLEAYPGVDYLGVGYDIIRGNPSGDGELMLDPGFRQPVRVRGRRHTNHAVPAPSRDRLSASRARALRCAT